MKTRSLSYLASINPNPLDRPALQQMDTRNSGQSSARRTTLLNPSEDKLMTPGPTREPRAPGTRASIVKSVFSTGHMWEKKMAKLWGTEREAARLSAVPPATMEANSAMSPSETSSQPQSEPSMNFPLAIAKVGARNGPPPPQRDNYGESDSDDSGPPYHEMFQHDEVEVNWEWFSDEGKPVERVSMVSSGPRYP